MNNLNAPEAEAVHDGNAAERERLEKVLYCAGPRRVTGRIRSVRRFMTELLLIAAAAAVGAPMGAYYYSGNGYHPVIGMAGTMAGLASSVGLVIFVWRSHRAGSRMLGGFVTRVAVMLLCVGAEFYGLTCVCDDVSQAMYLPRVTFEQGGLPH